MRSEVDPRSWHDHLTECWTCRAYGWGEADARCGEGQPLYEAYRAGAEASRPRFVDPVEAQLAGMAARLDQLQLDVSLLVEVVRIVIEQPLVKRFVGTRMSDALAAQDDDAQD